MSKRAAMMKPRLGQLVVVRTPNGTFKARVELLLAAQFYYEEVPPEGEMFIKHQRTGLMLFKQLEWEPYEANKHANL